MQIDVESEFVVRDRAINAIHKRFIETARDFGHSHVVAALEMHIRYILYQCGNELCVD